MKITKHWIVLLICCGLAAGTIGCTYNVGGVFLAPVSDSLGVLRGTFSVQSTIMSITGSIATLFIPVIMKRFAFKKVIVPCIIAAALATALMGTANGVYMLYILGALRGVATSLCSLVLLTDVINKWFYKKNGIAMSLVMSFTGISGAFLSPVLSALIEKVGWRGTYFIDGALVLLFSLPAIFYRFTPDPADCGEVPYGFDGKKEAVPEVKPSAKGAATVKKTASFNFRGKAFVLFCIYGFLCASVPGLSQHFASFGVSVGYSASVSAGLISAGMVGNIVFKVIIGIVSDKAGSVKAVLIMIGAAMAGTAAMIFAKSTGVMLAGAFLFGAAFASNAVGTPLLTKSFFGTENYSEVYPRVCAVSGFLSAFSVTIFGYVYDFTGSYIPSFAGSLVLLAIMAALALAVKAESSKNKKSAAEG